MKTRYALSVLVVIILAGCSANQTSMIHGTRNPASDGGVIPVNSHFGNVIHRYPTPDLPVLMATGSDRNVWFTTNAPRIGKITPGGVVTEYAIPSGVVGQDIAPGAIGFLWFGENTSGMIGKINTTNGHIKEINLPPGLNAPGGIAKGSDGNMWFTDQFSNNIAKITPSGKVTAYAVPTARACPNDIVAGPDGNLWFTEICVGQIGKITTAGVITEYTGYQGSNTTDSITAGPDGNLYAAYDGGVARITTSGVVALFPGAVGLSYYDIILGPDKHLWLSRVDGKMVEFNPITQRFSKAIRPGSAHIYGLTVGNDGDVWIANLNGSSILVFEGNIAPTN